jgi:hypothetical protein
MRRMLVTIVAAGALAALAAGTAGCDAGAAGAAPAAHAPAVQAPAVHVLAGGTEAEIYVQVLRRYLGTPAENSFPGQAFKTVYVLDRAHRDAADPGGNHDRGTPIAPQVQRQVTAALAGMARVVFITDRESVIKTRDGCAYVRSGGILITLGSPDGDGRQVRVAVNGFVACLGATWLTYVLRNQPGTGWRVTGTTGSVAIS